MGLIRYLLAASVVLGHSSAIFGVTMLDANLAVRLFFIISGFYMALILDRKYQTQRRVLAVPEQSRTADIPDVFCSAAGGADALRDRLVAHAGTVRSTGLLGGCVSNWAIWRVGHLYRTDPTDRSSGWTCHRYLDSFRPSTRFFFLVPQPAVAPIFAWRLNFLPHAWSISVELLYYLLAPLMFQLRARWLIGIIAGQILLNGSLLRFGPDLLSTMTVYHFFGCQLGYFRRGHARLSDGGIPSISALQLSGRRHRARCAGGPHLRLRLAPRVSLAYWSVLVLGCLGPARDVCLLEIGGLGSPSRRSILSLYIWSTFP